MYRNRQEFSREIIRVFSIWFSANSCQSISPHAAALTFSSLLIKARNHEWQYTVTANPTSAKFQRGFSVLGDILGSAVLHLSWWRNLSWSVREEGEDAVVQFGCLVCKSATRNITSFYQTSNCTKQIRRPWGSGENSLGIISRVNWIAFI